MREIRICISRLIAVLYIIARGGCLKDEGLIHLDAGKSKVYGPGLNPDFVVPVRYFFIQGVDFNSTNLTTSPSGTLTVHITGLRQPCRIWTQLLDCKDGSFISRYKLYQECLGLKIEVLYDGKPVADSPYILDSILHHENCFCPKPLPKWLSTMECPLEYMQIKEDLSYFSQIDMHSVLKDALKRFDKPGAYSFCHYAIKDNKVYRKCYGQYVGFSMFMDEILLSVARKVKLPDIEMLVNLGDWPLEHRSTSDSPIPIFSWCGSKDTRDIVMPTYDLTESTLEMMGRVMLDILSVQGNSGPNWEHKIEKGFWRGRDSRLERLDLVKLGRKYPELINASLTNFFFFRNQEQEYGPKSPHVSFFEFFKYKYQINIDGTVAAYRMPYLLAGGSVVLKQMSDYYEHFYHQLEPMVHFVPFNRNLSDLVDQLSWVKEHDEEVHGIAWNAKRFALDHLLPKDIFCYYTVLLKEYSKLLTSTPVINDEMELISQPTERATCYCQFNERAKDEL